MGDAGLEHCDSSWRVWGSEHLEGDGMDSTQTHEWKHLPGNDHWQQGWPQAKAAKPAPLVSLMQPLKDWCCWRKDCGFSLILAQESLADPSSAEPVMGILSSVPLG